MMEHESPKNEEPVDCLAEKHDDVGADHKKDDDAKKSSDEQKTLEERAQELYAYVIETAKHTDKRTLLLAKQRLEAKAKEFYRVFVTYMRERAMSDLILAKEKGATYMRERAILDLLAAKEKGVLKAKDLGASAELKAKAFAAAVVEMSKKINKENYLIFKETAKEKYLIYKETLQLRARELMLKAMKIHQTTNYRRVLKKDFQKDMMQKHGRLGFAILAMLMMVNAAFRNDGDEFTRGGRSLALQTPKTFEAAEHSLHPKWRLWHDIPEDQQHQALEELVPYLNKYGWLLGSSWSKQHIAKDKICDMVPNSPSDMCRVPKPEDGQCSFMSFGVVGKATFENNLAHNTKCKGFAVDPAETKPSRINPSVTFQNLGLPKLHQPEGEPASKQATWDSSIPTIRKFLKEEYTDILHLSCEGCEIALMRDILREDPSFFGHFGQISVMKYASKVFVNTEEDLYYFGLMFPLLEEAGHELVTSKVTGCRGKFEGDCMSEFNEWGYACGKTEGHSKHTRSCQDLLFAKEEIAYKEGLSTSIH